MNTSGEGSRKTMPFCEADMLMDAFTEVSVRAKLLWERIDPVYSRIYHNASLSHCPSAVNDIPENRVTCDVNASFVS